MSIYAVTDHGAGTKFLIWELEFKKSALSYIQADGFISNSIFTEPSIRWLSVGLHW